MTTPLIHLHDDPDFGELLREVSAASRGAISPEFVEKDYWVTVTLAALMATGFEVCCERFSPG